MRATNTLVRNLGGERGLDAVATGSFARKRARSRAPESGVKVGFRPRPRAPEPPAANPEPARRPRAIPSSAPASCSRRALERQNPHGSRGAPDAHRPAVSSLGGFRTPALRPTPMSASGPASETLHNRRHRPVVGPSSESEHRKVRRRFISPTFVQYLKLEYKSPSPP